MTWTDVAEHEERLKAIETVLKNELEALKADLAKEKAKLEAEKLLPNVKPAVPVPEVKAEVTETKAMGNSVQIAEAKAGEKAENEGK
jgi:hypothetical protein